MENITVFEAETRAEKGKSDARALRSAGRVPAIIYGGKGGEVAISLEGKSLTKAYQHGGFTSKVIDIKTEKETIRVLPREVQLHPVTDKLLHVDLLRVDESKKIRVAVKVKFINAEKSPGMKRGGILNIVRHEIELMSPLDRIPETLIADLNGLQIGDSMHISAIALPEGVEPTITDRDFTVATIAGRIAKDETQEGATGGEAAAGSEEKDQDSKEE